VSGAVLSKQLRALIKQCREEAGGVPK
jgi:hypothetical protein